MFLLGFFFEGISSEGKPSDSPKILHMGNDIRCAKNIHLSSSLIPFRTAFKPFTITMPKMMTKFLSVTEIWSSIVSKSTMVGCVEPFIVPANMECYRPIMWHPCDSEKLKINLKEKKKKEKYFADQNLLLHIDPKFEFLFINSILMKTFENANLNFGAKNCYF